MHYFDTSFLVPFFVDEPASARIEQFLKRQTQNVATVSQWTCIEFSAAVARRVRAGTITTERATKLENTFDLLMIESFLMISPTAKDYELARQFLRRYETGLRSGDALHLAIASNHGAQAIYSLDEGLIRAGQILGLPTQTGIRLR
jgi:predicted nucleic acid-binding protein